MTSHSLLYSQSEVAMEVPVFDAKLLITIEFLARSHIRFYQPVVKRCWAALKEHP